MKLSQKWREEIDYCAELITSRGNSNVGAAANVAPYLDCQVVGARRDNLLTLARRFETAAAHVRSNNWGQARVQMCSSR